jgi:HSP20 family protein
MFRSLTACSPATSVLVRDAAAYTWDDLDVLPVDIALTDDRVVITADVPGSTAGDIDIRLAGDHLVIGAKRTGAHPGRYLRRERAGDQSRRAVALPVRVDAEGITAAVKDGVLTVTLPRAASDRPRSVPVHEA